MGQTVRCEIRIGPTSAPQDPDAGGEGALIEGALIEGA